MKKLSFFIVLVIAIFAAQTTSIFAQSAALVGNWKDGGVGLIQYQNQTTGAMKPGRGNIFAYKFSANGNYEFIGYMESTLYNCTTMLFNEVKGKYTIEGSVITLNPSRDFWKSGNSCAPNSNKEKLKEPAEVSYEYQIKEDDYGNELLCLSDDKGERCFKREKE